MSKKDLLKKDNELIRMKNKFILDIQTFIINKGILKDNIYFEEWDNTITVDTDENWNNVFILESLEELHLKSIEIDSRSDKNTIISITG